MECPLGFKGHGDDEKLLQLAHLNSCTYVGVVSSPRNGSESSPDAESPLSAVVGGRSSSAASPVRHAILRKSSVRRYDLDAMEISGGKNARI